MRLTDMHTHTHVRHDETTDSIPILKINKNSLLFFFKYVFGLCAYISSFNKQELTLLVFDKCSFKTYVLAMWFLEPADHRPCDMLLKKVKVA